MNLEEIIKSCIKQNRRAQEELYQLYNKILFALCLKYCTDKTEAEDVLHDTFIEIFTNIKNYKGKGSFEGWMKRIAINKAISRFKSGLKTQPIEGMIYPIVETEIEVFDDEIALDTLLELIQNLPSQYRMVFNLYELDDYSHKEISEMLGISEGTSKSNLHKAKVILKNKIIEMQPKKAKNGI